MDTKNLYVPNHEKWIKYYETSGQLVHIHSNLGKKLKNLQTGGSISKTISPNIVPVETEREIVNYKHYSPESVSVNLITPSKASTEQAHSEVQRERMKGIKRKRKMTVRRKTSSVKGHRKWSPARKSRETRRKKIK